MKVFGIDFTSSPSRHKPIACARCELKCDELRLEAMDAFADFTQFENVLVEPGPWIAGIDFPFGQSERFLRNIGWPDCWPEYVRLVSGLSRSQFKNLLEAYKKGRPSGDKEHARKTDVLAGSISPQKLYGVPVGLMFFEGAPRLMQSGACIPGLMQGDASRSIVEAYPGVLARSIIGRTSYKNDKRSMQTAGQGSARRAILDGLRSESFRAKYGVRVRCSDAVVEDPKADHLDALLCAVQAAWTRTRCGEVFLERVNGHASEGWIADPNIVPTDEA